MTGLRSVDDQDGIHSQPRRTAPGNPERGAGLRGWSPPGGLRGCEAAEEDTKKLAAFLDGFSLQAGAHPNERDREGMGHLLRYALRPLISQERLTRAGDGRVVLSPRRPRYGGTTGRLHAHGADPILAQSGMSFFGRVGTALGWLIHDDLKLLGYPESPEEDRGRPRKIKEGSRAHRGF